jgi:U4/U6.U5 tri-snRNP-associated protein 1
MNEKEAFRFLSHRFHGKGSGKKKTEKRAKKLAEEDVNILNKEENKTK